MYRLAAIALLLIHTATLSVPAVLCLVRTAMRQQARAAALQQVSADKHTKFVLTENDYEQALRDERKELYFAGCMHDIISTHYSNDSVVVVCIRDEAETALHAAINKEQNSAMHRDGRVKHLIHLIVSGQSAVLSAAYSTFFPVARAVFLCATPTCIERHGEPLVPPPRSMMTQ